MAVVDVAHNWLSWLTGWLADWPACGPLNVNLALWLAGVVRLSVLQA